MSRQGPSLSHPQSWPFRKATGGTNRDLGSRRAQQISPFPRGATPPPQTPPPWSVPPVPCTESGWCQVCVYSWFLFTHEAVTGVGTAGGTWREVEPPGVWGVPGPGSAEWVSPNPGRGCRVTGTRIHTGTALAWIWVTLPSTPGGSKAASITPHSFGVQGTAWGRCRLPPPREEQRGLPQGWGLLLDAAGEWGHTPGVPTSPGVTVLQEKRVGGLGGLKPPPPLPQGPCGRTRACRMSERETIPLTTSLSSTTTNRWTWRGVTQGGAEGVQGPRPSPPRPPSTRGQLPRPRPGG